jgi:hypothetical protein
MEAEPVLRSQQSITKPQRTYTYKSIFLWNSHYKNVIAHNYRQSPLFILRIFRDAQCRMAGWIIKVICKGRGRKCSWPGLRYYPHIFLEGLRKTTIHFSQDSWSPQQATNQGPSRYETGVLTTRPQFSVQRLIFPFASLHSHIQQFSDRRHYIYLLVPCRVIAITNSLPTPYNHSPFIHEKKSQNGYSW